MSLATFKRKTVNKYSSATKISGKPPGGHWLPRGPFGRPDTTNSLLLEDGIRHVGPEGFSLNGGTRSITAGRSMRFSQRGTPFKGVHPCGNGGHGGRYARPPPVMNAGHAQVAIQGNQYKYVKPSSLSTYGMLRSRFKWAYSGTYPTNWTQPVYTGNQTDSASQAVYIASKSAASDCVSDVNNAGKYREYFRRTGPMGCQLTPARGYTMSMMQSNAPYTKTLRQPRDASSQLLRVQRKCQDPQGRQKPFPYAVQTGTGVQRGGTSVSSVASACFTSNTTTVPPAWYTRERNGLT